MIYPEYQKFNKPLIEFCLKYDEMGDPFVSEDFLLKLKWLDQESLDLIKSYTLAINDFLVKCFDRKMVHLADAKFEFGRNQHGRIMLADELSPDGMRLWQYKYGGGKFDSLDKDLFRKGLGGETEAYTKIAKMLGLFPEDA
jgi:phosphoribosylaminoimidazole-succinocarboxamide synthase